MEEILATGELLWEEHQRAASAQARIELRLWFRNFALVLALIGVIVALTMLLPAVAHIETTSLVNV